MARNLGPLLSNSLLNVESDFVPIPIGWGGPSGEALMRKITMEREKLVPRLSEITGMTKKEFEQCTTISPWEWWENKSWIKLFYAYGRKP